MRECSHLSQVASHLSQVASRLSQVTQSSVPVVSGRVVVKRLETVRQD
jgi:hypothetical protein